MLDVLVLGAGGHARVVADILMRARDAGERISPVGYLDDDSEAQGQPAVCTLSWSQPADEIAALVRALDFGPYTNPLGLPKLVVMTEDQVDYVCSHLIEIVRSQSLT